MLGGAGTALLVALAVGNWRFLLLWTSARPGRREKSGMCWQAGGALLHGMAGLESLPLAGGLLAAAVSAVAAPGIAEDLQCAPLAGLLC